MAEKEISQAVIGRLPRYFRFLGELKDEGVERISSQELSGIMNVTASQIRQDFNNLADSGSRATATTSNICIRKSAGFWGWIKPTT